MYTRLATAALVALLVVSSLTAQEAKPGGVPVRDATVRELPADYVSDNCSMFFDGCYADCCVEHDRAYFFGGTKKERRAADAALFKCVRARGHKYISRMMWLGVRIGGVGFLPTKFRWGFGKNWKSKHSPVQKPARELGPNNQR